MNRLATVYDPMNEGPLPDYANPPVVETILGVQFKRLRRVTNAHLGAFWRTLGARWPAVEDAVPLPPQVENFAPSAQWSRIGAQLTLTQVSSSRLQIRNKDGDRMIQVQRDRLNFNWLGQGGADYPRYGKLREGFLSSLHQFVDFLGQEELGEFIPTQWEVTYLNHIPKGTVWNTPRDWGFFRPLAGMPSMKVQDESFDGVWHFVIPEQRGRLHVQWRHGIVEAEEKETIVLTFTARGPLAESQDKVQAVLDGLDLGRRTIVQSFRALMGEAANTYWGLKHDED